MNDLWKTKLAAWVHDPAEKALVLLRSPEGHEGGTVRELRHRLFGAADDPALAMLVKQADHWAAAADRPQFPREAGGGRFQPWARVDFVADPVLVHPLSGSEYKLVGGLATNLAALKKLSLSHFAGLIQEDGGRPDFRRTFLSFWRWGPEFAAPDLGELWKMLPADTRVPDHTIWEHLRLTSAFAGCLADGGSPALLAVSLGPVQSFIAQARSTSDLWAGSHLLATLAWKALEVVCDRLGPDAVLFPDLHGVPAVDAWLDQAGVKPPDCVGEPEWRRLASDANPLFTAALPNRFVALVPAGQAAELARDMEQAVRAYALDHAREAWRRVLEGAGAAMGGGAGLDRIEAQLAGFPEFYWAAVPWSLVAERAEGRELDTGALESALGAFGSSGSHVGGFLEGDAWKVLGKGVDVGGATFYRPNPGVLYPALYELLERVVAGVKATRTFAPSTQRGFRCSLCGEREWLSLDAQRHLAPRGRQNAAEPWASVTERCPHWAKGGEHLCALCTLKRVWPSMFADDVAARIGKDGGVRRFVVSTHTMALAPTLERLARADLPADDVAALESLVDDVGDEGTALPRRLIRRLDQAGGQRRLRLARQLPAKLDRLREEEDGEERLRRLESAVRKATGLRTQDYYALLLLDGDGMGAWLSGEKLQVTYQGTWHPKVRHAARAEGRGSPSLEGYLGARRPASPSCHAAISSALNSFALEVAPRLVEEQFTGRVLYAGGDDLLAMVGIDQVLPLMLALRCAYSGTFPTQDAKATWELLGVDEAGMHIGQGHVLTTTRCGERRLLRMMGAAATASVGAVIAHHQTPLGSVLRELRQAERAAKNAGRDAFSVSLMKRAGGTTRFTTQWLLGSLQFAASPMGVLSQLRRVLASDVSRRAAYLVTEWLHGVPTGGGALPTPQLQELLEANLRYQLTRQARGGRAEELPDLPGLARDLAAVACRARSADPAGWLAEAVQVAEFLAREGRARSRR